MGEFVDAQSACLEVFFDNRVRHDTKVCKPILLAIGS